MKKQTKAISNPKKVLVTISLAYLVIWGLMLTNTPVNPTDHTFIPTVQAGSLSTAGLGFAKPASQKITTNIDERKALDQLLGHYIIDITKDIRHLQFHITRVDANKMANIQLQIDDLFEQKFQLEIFQNEIRQTEESAFPALKSVIIKWLKENRTDPLVS